MLINIRLDTHLFRGRGVLQKVLHQLLWLRLGIVFFGNLLRFLYLEFEK